MLKSQNKLGKYIDYYYTNPENTSYPTHKNINNKTKSDKLYTKLRTFGYENFQNYKMKTLIASEFTNNDIKFFGIKTNTIEGLDKLTISNIFASLSYYHPTNLLFSTKLNKNSLMFELYTFIVLGEQPFNFKVFTN